MTKAELARRIGKNPDRVNHMLAFPGNWTIQTIAELLAAVGDEEFVPNAIPLKGRAARNMAQDDLLGKRHDNLKVEWINEPQPQPRPLPDEWKLEAKPADPDLVAA